MAVVDGPQASAGKALSFGKPTGFVEGPRALSTAWLISKHHESNRTWFDPERKIVLVNQGMRAAPA